MLAERENFSPANTPAGRFCAIVLVLLFMFRLSCFAIKKASFWLAFSHLHCALTWLLHAILL